MRRADRPRGRFEAHLVQQVSRGFVLGSFFSSEHPLGLKKRGVTVYIDNSSNNGMITFWINLSWPQTRTCTRAPTSLIDAPDFTIPPLEKRLVPGILKSESRQTNYQYRVWPGTGWYYGQCEPFWDQGNQSRGIPTWKKLQVRVWCCHLSRKSVLQYRYRHAALMSCHVIHTFFYTLHTPDTSSTLHPSSLWPLILIYYGTMALYYKSILTLLGLLALQSRLGDKLLRIRLVSPQKRTAVLTVLKGLTIWGLQR